MMKYKIFGSVDHLGGSDFAPLWGKKVIFNSAQEAYNFLSECKEVEPHGIGSRTHLCCLQHPVEGNSSDFYCDAVILPTVEFLPLGVQERGS